jgi:hypothetical protein
MKKEFIAKRDKPGTGLWYIEDEYGDRPYESTLIKADAELIANIHNETGLRSFEEIVAEIEKRGLSLAPAIGEVVTWTWYRRYAPMYVEIDCKVIGYSSTRVRIDAGVDGIHTVAAEFLAPRGKPTHFHPEGAKPVWPRGSQLLNSGISIVRDEKTGYPFLHFSFAKES